MLDFNKAFGAVNASRRRERRFALRIDMGGGVELWIVSHADVVPGSGTVVDARIRKLSNLSQRVRPTEGRSEIGALSFTITDIGASLTDELRTQLLTHERGAFGKRVQLFVGDRRIPFASYELVTTQILQSCQASRSGTEISFRCADVQRGSRRRVFEAKETRLTAPISDTATTIPVVDATVLTGVDHGTGWSDAPSTDGVIYFRIDDEIIRTLQADRTATTFTNCIRGVLGTRAAEHTTDEGVASSPDKGKKVEEVVYLEGPAVKLAYAIQTGVQINQLGTWPEHWHAGLVAADVKLTDYTGIGKDVYDPDDDTAGIIFRFVDPGAQDAKRFVETEIMRPAGLFQPVLADGQLGLRRIRRIVAGAAAVVTLRDRDLTAAPAIDLRGEDVRNDILLKWNEVDGDLTRSVEVVDEGSQGKWGAREQYVIEARGLHGSRNSRSRVVAIVQQAFDRRSSPPLSAKGEVSTRFCGIELGDLVRLATSHARLWTGASGAVDHPFEVQAISTDWLRGRVSLTLEGSSQAADPLKPLGTDTSIPDAWFVGTGTDIAGLTGVVDQGDFLEVTADLTLSGNADLTAAGAVYYAGKDLTIAAGVTVTYDQNVQLRVRGVMTVNGKLDGKGGGLTGVADTLDVSGIPDYPTQLGPVDVTFQSGQAGGFGVTQAHGGLIERVRQESVGSRFFGVLQSVPAPLTTGAFDVMPLFQLEYRGGDVEGLPADLRGSSGGPGGLRYYEDTLPSPNLVQVNRGGTGGAGGAGLALITRGFAFGASGQIDSSGLDGSVGAYAAGNAQPAHAGGGAGGAPGGILIVVDGALNPAPGTITGKVVADYGSAPLPSASYTELPDPLIMDTKFGFGFEVPDDRFTRDLSSSSGVDASAAATRIQFMPSASSAEEDIDDAAVAARQQLSLTAAELYSSVADNGRTVVRLTVQEISVDSLYSHAMIYGRTTSGPGPWERFGPAEPTRDIELPADGVECEFVPVPVLTNNLEADFSDRGTGTTITVTSGTAGVPYAIIDNAPTFFDQPTEPSSLVSDDGDRWWDNDDFRYYERDGGAWQLVATANAGSLERSRYTSGGTFTNGAHMPWTYVDGDAPITIVGGDELEFDEPGVYMLNLRLVVEDDTVAQNRQLVLTWEERPDGGSWSDVTNGIISHANPERFRFVSSHQTVVVATAANHRARLEETSGASGSLVEFDSGTSGQGPTALEVIRLVQEPKT